MRHVIIGTGIAGVQAVEAIRRLDRAAAITMIGDEPAQPYCRPMISMLLEGSIPPERLPIRGPAFFDAAGVTAILGQRVTAIDVEERRVIVGGQRSVPFDRLLIASGADPRMIKAEGRDLPGIFPMRTATQVQQMLALLPATRSALVLGGGLVGFKAAHALIRRGIRVTMLIASPYPLSMQVDQMAGMMIREEMTRQGLDVRVEVEALGFEGRGRVRAARLSDGSTLPCDLVVVGKGVLPALAFVPRDRIAVDLGILVDEHLATSATGIYAAGDVAEALDIARDRRWVNAIWPEAASQGMVAGMNMAGRRVAYPGSLSRNVIRVFGLDIMTGGLVNPPAGDDYRTLQHHDPRRGIYRKLVFRDLRLVGAVMAGEIAQGGMLLSLIRSRLPLAAPPEALLSPALNYRQLMPASSGRAESG